MRETLQKKCILKPTFLQLKVIAALNRSVLPDIPLSSKGHFLNLLLHAYNTYIYVRHKCSIIIHTLLMYNTYI